jgi:hypothetical protein
VVRTLTEAVAALNEAGAAQVYIDGGKVVQACLAAAEIGDGMIQERYAVVRSLSR